MEKEKLIFNEDIENYNSYDKYAICVDIKKNNKNAKITLTSIPVNNVIDIKNIHKNIDLYKIFLEIVDPDILINEKEAEKNGMEYDAYKYDYIFKPNQYRDYIDFMYYIYNEEQSNRNLVKMESINVLSGLININKDEYNLLKITDSIEFEIPLREFDENDYERIEYAVQKGYYFIARAIILNNVRYRYYFNQALHETMLKSLIDNNNKKGIIKILNKIGSEKEITNENGYNLLHYAIESGNIEMTNFLLNLKNKYLGINQKIKKINSKKYNYSPLMLAIESENYDMTKFLIDMGAKINYYYPHKINGNILYKSPIYCAIQKENLDIISLLFNSGMDPNKIDKLQFSPLLYAALYGKIKVIKFLCALNCIDKKIILNSDRYIEKMGYTALHFAAEGGNKDIVNILLLNDLFVDVEDSLYQTPLIIAAKNNKYEVVELLIKNYANPNIIDLNNATPLFYAIQNKNKNIIKILVEKGAIFNLEIERDYKLIKLNLFINAVKNKDKEIINFLLTNFSDKIEINAKNDSGKTALTEAICNKDIELAKSLIIDYKANINDIDIKEAKKINKKEFIELLKNYKKRQEINSLNIK